MKKLIVFLVCCALASCAIPTVVRLTSPFNAAEATHLLRAGSNAIQGSSLFRIRDGSVRTCGGLEVILRPVTGYTEERYMHQFGNTQKGYRSLKDGFKFIPDIPEYYEAQKTQVCGAAGQFHFDNLADGEYFVSTTIAWERLSQTIFGTVLVADGGTLMQRVKVSGGETVRMTLSP